MVQIKISWLLQKLTDLDLHCLLRQGMLCSARGGLKKCLCLQISHMRTITTGTNSLTVKNGREGLPIEMNGVEDGIWVMEMERFCTSFFCIVPVLYKNEQFKSKIH